jgi:flagellar biosynthesis/type III secretory pathway protein FliH
MADDPNEILGHVIAETIKPLLKRIEQLELRVSMADDFKRLESRLQQLEQREPAKPTLRVVNDGHG